MTDFPTYRDLFRVARDEALTRNSKLTVDAVEREGTDTNALIAANASTGDECITQLAQVEAGLLLSSAKKDRLDKLVFDRYQLIRKAAAPAVVTQNFATTAPAASGFNIPAGTRIGTTDGRVFSTLADVAFPAGSSGPISVDAQSQLSGASQSARIGTITSILDFPAGAPTDLTTTNPVATFGADDEEIDDDFRKRARAFYATARRGTLGAIEQAAIGIPGVSKAYAFEQYESNGFPARIVNLVVTDAFSEQLVDYTTTPASYQTQSTALINTVATGLNDVRAAGIPVAVTIGVTILVNITLALRYQNNVNQAAASIAARTAVQNYVNGLVPGTALTRANILAVLQTVPGVIADSGAILAPANDLTATPVQVFRTTLGTVRAVVEGTF